MSSYYQGYTVRLYPTKEQEQKFRTHIHGCRWMWNEMLRIHQDVYKKEKKNLSNFSMNNLITGIKKVKKWLKNTPHASLQRICRDLYHAFELFLNKKASIPKLKRKRTARDTYPIRNERLYFKNNEYVRIPSVGLVKYEKDFGDEIQIGNHKCKFCDARIHKNVRGKWLLTFTILRENQATGDFKKPLSNDTMGIDIGTHKLATIQFGEKSFTIDNINKTKKMQRLAKRRRRAQSRLSRKQQKMYEYTTDEGETYHKPSKNYIKCQRKFRKLCKREQNIRKDYVYKETTKLVEMLPKEVVMEDLDIIGMMQNKHLTEDISNANWDRFVYCMRYKCQNRGISFKQVPQHYPSSQTCSKCGSINKSMKRYRKDRLFTCPVCGNIMDRDVNAATNLMNYFK